MSPSGVRTDAVLNAMGAMGALWPRQRHSALAVCAVSWLLRFIYAPKRIGLDFKIYDKKCKK